MTEFSVKNGKIRFGLAAVKSVGIGVIDEIILERNKNGLFKSFEDFALRCAQYINKRAVENLIFAGAFDCFNVYRSKLIAVYEEILDKAQRIVKERESAQMSIFGMMGIQDKIEVTYPNLKEYDSKIKLSHEKEVIGVYVSGHPLSNYEGFLSRFTFNSMRLLNKLENDEGETVYLDVSDGDYVEMGGIITSFKKSMTRTGQPMCSLTIEDLYGSVECVMFSNVYEKYRNEIESDAIVKISGKLQIKEGREPSIRIDKFSQFNENKVEEKKEEKKQYLVLTTDSLDSNDDLYDILLGYPGEVLVYIIKGGKKFKLNYNVRYCRGLVSELESILDSSDIKFIET